VTMTGRVKAAFVRWQSRTSGKLTLAALLVVAASAVLGPMWWSSVSYQALQQRIAAQLAKANSVERTPEAVQLIDNGTVTVDGRDFGGVRVREVASQLFDAQGRMAQPEVLASLVAQTEAPSWAPLAIVERPELPLVAWIACVTLACISVWIGLAGTLVLAVTCTVAVVAPFWLLGMLAPTVALAGAGTLLFLFAFLTRIVMLALGRPTPVAGIAQNVMREALRQRVPVGFIVTLLVLLPLLPLWIDSKDPLRYQIQTFIDRGTTLVYAFAACMTLLLACSSVAFEMRDRQIWHVLTKPVSRVRYVAGKWIGICALNGTVLAVGFLAVFIYVQFMRTRPAADLLDAAAVREQVLVARVGSFPQYELLDRERLLAAVDAAIDADATLRSDIESGKRRELDVRAELATQKLAEFGSAQRSIEPGKGRTYTFRGLSDARRAGVPVTLKFEFHIGRDDTHETHPVIFRFADGSWIDRKYVPTQPSFVTVPAEVIAEDGTLAVEIMNVGFDGQGFMPGALPLNFDDDGIEVMHRVGSFEANFLRAALVDWAKLIFLGALGVATASILSFPVATLLSFTIFLTASMSAYLAIALDRFSAPGDADLGVRAFYAFVQVVAGGAQGALSAFGDAATTQDLVEGRVIPWSMVLKAAGLIAALWSLVAFGIAWIGFSRKEIAIYSGTGGG
jgi:hypothetical protein